MPRRGRATRVVCSTSRPVPPVARGVDERESERDARQSAALESTPHSSALLTSPLLSSLNHLSGLCCVLIFGSAFGLHIKTISFFLQLSWKRGGGEGEGLFRVHFVRGAVAPKATAVATDELSRLQVAIVVVLHLFAQSAAARVALCSLLIPLSNCCSIVLRDVLPKLETVANSDGETSRPVILRIRQDGSI